MAQHILIASPVNKDAKILREFLRSLKGLEFGDNSVSYCFVDDNGQQEAAAMLADFVTATAGASLLELEGLPKQAGDGGVDRYWNKYRTERIAYIKNRIIEHFLAGPYTHLFFVDADVLLQPPTLTALLESDKDIIANIFWTKWRPDAAPLPQVWQKDHYTLYDDHMLAPKTADQKQMETTRFLCRLMTPGVYRVGGLGACTLIRRKALVAGVNFNEIYNLSFWGEDRSFCIRAVALGFELYVNTIYPAFHIYRMEDLQELPQWHMER